MKIPKKDIYKLSGLSTISAKEAQPITFEFIEKQFKALAARPLQPSYPLWPDYIVDAALERGIIPQFVTISSRSAKKIKQYIKDHPEME